MNFENIIIPDRFLNSKPLEKKYNFVKSYYEKYGELDKKITVEDDVLVDGYIRYLVLKENNYSGNIEVKNISSFRNKYNVLIYGIHPNSKDKTEYKWRIPIGKNLGNIKVGDFAICQTKYGLAPVQITKIENVFLDENAPSFKKVVRLIKKEDFKQLKEK